MIRTSMMKNLTTTALASLCLLAAAGSGAHETWLLPEDFRPTAEETTQLYMTSGMGFPALASGISSARVREAVLSQDGERDALVPAGNMREALTLSAIPGPGVACAWVSLRPRVLELEPDSVAHYLEEIGAGETVWAVWEAQPEPKEWRESYAKLARTYLRSDGSDVADEDNANCWKDASNSRFEILPLADPTTLEPGDTLAFQVLFDGEPLADQAVNVIREGSDPTAMQSGSDGRITVSFSGPGRHMIYATNLRPIADQDEYNWQSDFVTLTLPVGSLP